MLIIANNVRRPWLPRGHDSHPSLVEEGPESPGFQPAGGTLQPMVNRNLLAQFDLPEDQQEVEGFFGEEDWLPPQEQPFDVNRIVNGTVRHVNNDVVVVDVGYKSEGIIPTNEWYDEGMDKVVPPQA